MPVRFLHLNIKMAGGFLNIGKRQIPFGVRDVTDLIEPCHSVANMGCVGHRLFAGAGKGEGGGRQRNFIRRGKTAMRCRAKRFPSWFGHNFIFQCCCWFECREPHDFSGVFLSMYCIKRRWVARSDWVATSAIRFMS
jgi:hypothetical protein